MKSLYFHLQQTGIGWSEFVAHLLDLGTKRVKKLCIAITMTEPVTDYMKTGGLIA